MVQETEAAPYYFRYINLVSDRDIVAGLENQLTNVLPFLSVISEEKSLHRYAPDKWSIRQVMNHVNDVERVFLFRALWFARGFTAPLPGFDQEASSARADDFAWSDHVEEFRNIRLATLSFFRNLPKEHWSRRGTADGNPFTVNSLAYIISGHLSHHQDVLQQRYL
ncbi:MAG TPA: DinB family protein [Pyrinomonadaceae bacterium]